MLLNSTQGLNIIKGGGNQDDTEPQDWATAAAPWIGSDGATGPKPGSVVSHVFAFGKAQSYTNVNNKFGEYRLLVKYPSSSTPNEFQQIIPTQRGTDNVASWARQDGSQDTEQNVFVDVNFGDFYYPEYANLNYFYEYQVGDGLSSASATDFGFQGGTVYAREWSLKYVSQFYTDSSLLTKWNPNQQVGNFHSYRSVLLNDQNQNSISAKEGTNNSNIVSLGSPTPTAALLGSTINDYSNSNRFFIAQFDATGKKIAGTAQPSYGSFN